MHAKVYLPRGGGAVAIVGSANLSANALADEGTSIQFEAAVLVLQASVVEQASVWFEALWTHALPITKEDIDDAKKSWDAARRDERARRRIVRQPPVVPGVAGPRDPIKEGKFLKELRARPDGAMLTAVARSILASAREMRVREKWNPRGFSLYIDLEGERPVGLLVVLLNKSNETDNHLGIWRYQSAPQNRSIDKCIADVLGPAPLSAQGNQRSFQLKDAAGKARLLVTGLAKIARA